jgi:hypothetical protein
MKVLLLTPRDDRSSKRSAAWADRLLKQFPSILSPHTTRSREEVEALLREHRHVLYFGHGEIDALVVPPRPFRSRQALIDNSNVTGTPGRVIVAVACWSGDGLARTVTGTESSPPPAEAYVGWRDEVSWLPEWADPIGDAVVEGLTVLLDGGTVRDCALALDAAFARAHDRYRREGPKRLTSGRAAIAKMCASYWRARIAVEGEATARL